MERDVSQKRSLLEDHKQKLKEAHETASVDMNAMIGLLSNNIIVDLV